MPPRRHWNTMPMHRVPVAALFLARPRAAELLCLLPARCSLSQGAARCKRPVTRMRPCQASEPTRIRVQAGSEPAGASRSSSGTAVDVQRQLLQLLVILGGEVGEEDILAVRRHIARRLLSESTTRRSSMESRSACTPPARC